MTLRCSGCKETKPRTAFNTRTDRARGYASQCKACKILRRSAVAAEKRRAGYRLWVAKNPDKAKLATQRWRAKNKEYCREKRRSGTLARYGLTPAMYDALFAAQGNRCAICAADKSAGKGWSVDHNHATGKVRAILCSACNTGIGLLRDDPGLLETAATYLRKHA